MLFRYRRSLAVKRKLLSFPAAVDSLEKETFSFCSMHCALYRENKRHAEQFLLPTVIFLVYLKSICAISRSVTKTVDKCFTWTLAYTGKKKSLAGRRRDIRFP